MAFANWSFICLISPSEEKCWSTKSKTLTTLPMLPPKYRIPAKPPFSLNPLKNLKYHFNKRKHLLMN